MDGDRPFAPSGFGTKLAAMIVAGEDLDPKTREVAFIPVPARVATRTVTGNQSPLLPADPTPQRSLRPAGARLLVGDRDKQQGESLGTAETPLD